MKPHVDFVLLRSYNSKGDHSSNDTTNHDIFIFYANTPRYFGVEITPERIQEYEGVLSGEPSTLKKIAANLKQTSKTANDKRKITHVDIAWNISLIGNSLCQVTLDRRNPSKISALGDCISCTKDLCCPACVLILNQYNILSPNL